MPAPMLARLLLSRYERLSLMPKWSKDSLVIVLAKNVGMIKGAQVLQFIWSWGDVMEKLGS